MKWIERRKFFVFAVMLLLWAQPTLAASLTLTGVINENYQLVCDDGQIYEFADTDLSNEVASRVGSRVSVTGTLEASDGFKFITVSAYQELEAPKNKTEE